MLKNYNVWTEIKTFLQNIQPRVYFRNGDIWFCHMGQNIGFEQNGRGNKFLRPVIVLKKFNNNIFWAIPLTRTLKNNKYYHLFSFQANSQSAAILTQLRLMDGKRLKYKTGKVRLEEMHKIKEKLKHLLE